MTILEQKKQELEARGTTGSTLIATTALSLALLFAQYSYSPVTVDDRDVKFALTEGTVLQPLSLRLSEMDLFDQINRLYDDMLKNQVELDADSKRALYKNLWDLYT